MLLSEGREAPTYIFLENVGQLRTSEYKRLFDGLDGDKKFSVGIEAMLVGDEEGFEFAFELDIGTFDTDEAIGISYNAEDVAMKLDGLGMVERVRVIGERRELHSPLRGVVDFLQQAWITSIVREVFHTEELPLSCERSNENAREPDGRADEKLQRTRELPQSHDSTNRARHYGARPRPRR